MKTDCELEEVIIQYVKKQYEENKNKPSLRDTCKHFKNDKLNFTRFYKIFPRGIPEVYGLAGVPVPKERIKRVEKATKAARARSERVGKDLLAVEDERVKEFLVKTSEWKKRGDRAKALLDAKKREKEARTEALRMEAQLDPRKIPAYLEDMNSPLLNDLREACVIEKESLEDACVKAVENWDPNACSKSKTFHDYVEYCISEWTWSVRLDNAIKKYSKMTFDCCCLECNVKYEYVSHYEFPRCLIQMPHLWENCTLPMPNLQRSIALRGTLKI
jgi:hypothetical protein